MDETDFWFKRGEDIWHPVEATLIDLEQRLQIRSRGSDVSIHYTWQKRVYI